MTDTRHPAEVEADEATRMPRWFWLAAPVVFVAAVALSAIWPWGFGVAP